MGDALHTTTWHLGGATLRRPGLHPVVTARMSLLYLGLPVVFVSCFAVGLTSRRDPAVPRAVALLFLLAGPGGAVLAMSQLPAIPSGALAVFSLAMAVLGCSSPRGRRPRPPMNGA